MFNHLRWTTPWLEVVFAAAIGATIGYYAYAQKHDLYCTPSNPAGLVATSTAGAPGASGAPAASGGPAARGLSDEAQLNALAVQWARDLDLPVPRAVCRRTSLGTLPNCNVSSYGQGLWALHCDLDAGYCFFLGDRR